MVKAKDRKPPKKPTNKIVKVPKEPKSNSKVRKKPQYKSFRLHKSIKHNAPVLPSWWHLLKKSFSLINSNKKAILFFFIIYGALSLVLVRGFTSPINIDSIKDELSTAVGEESSDIEVGFTAFGTLIGSTAQGTGEAAQIYQLFLIIFSSLAIIWLFRQQQAGNDVGIRMAFYRGMYPLVPVVIVFFVILLQLIPMIVGNFIFTTVLTGGLAVGFLQNFLWILFFIATILLSLYMICSSTIAVYIATLPEVEPLEALREARELVRHRRLSIMFRIVAIILVIVASLFVFVLPVIFIAPALAEWMFFAITVLAIPLVHGYMFSLYRELL